MKRIPVSPEISSGKKPNRQNPTPSKRMNRPEERTCILAAEMTFWLLSIIWLMSVTRSSQALRHARPFGNIVAQSGHSPLQQDLQQPIAVLSG